MDQIQGYVLTKKIHPEKYMYYLKLFDEQIELHKKYPNYILGIINYEESTKKDQLTITYNCSEGATSLSELQLNTFEEKIRMFDQLLEIAEFLEKNNIKHNNIKKNNLIIDNNKLYLSDFGYIEGDSKINMFRDELNFINPLNQNQKRQIYPYLTTDLFNALQSYDEEKLRLKLQNRVPKEIMKYDQHVLTSLMVEIFSPLELNNCNLSFLKNFSFSQKIMFINEANNPNFKHYAIFIIQQILQFRFQKENQLTPEFPKRLEPMLKKIDRQRLINAHNEELIQDYLVNKDFEFDLGLLYCFTKDKLSQIQFDLVESDQDFDCIIKKEISRILAIPNQLAQMNDFNKLLLGDQLLCLVYLDEQIENFEISNYKDQSQEKKQLLYNYTLKWQLLQFYDEINNIPKEQFKINQAFQKYYRKEVAHKQNESPKEQENNFGYSVIQQKTHQQKKISEGQINNVIQLQIQPETHEYNEILKEYINHIKVEMEFDVNECENIGKDTVIIRQRDKKDQIITYKSINKGEMIIHEVQDNTILQYCKHLKVLIFNRHFQSKPIIMFKLIKEFEILKRQVIGGVKQEVKLKDYNQQIKYKGEYDFDQENIYVKNKAAKQEVKLIDYKQQIKYEGEYDFDSENRDIIFQGKGTREILETHQTTLQIGDVYKVEGTFHNNILEGDSIKTYYYHFDENKRTYSEGQYRNGQLSGKHVHYLEKSQEVYKIIYHCTCCFCSSLLSCYSWCAWCIWCPCFFNYYVQIN